MPSLSHPRAPLTVGLDIGTTAVKAVAVDEDGTVVARTRVPHEVLAPSAGRLEHDPEQAWVEGPRRALDALAVTPAAVAVSTLTPSLAPVDGTGRPRPPGILYDDERGRPTGPYRGSDPTRSPETVELLRWVAASHPDAAGYWPAQAVAGVALGGPPAVDYATAASSGPLFDGLDWDATTCESCGIRPGQLPQVRIFGEPLGEIPLGGDGGACTLVAGSVDALCEQLVAGPLGPDDALVVLGSTLVVWCPASEPRDVPGLWVAPQLSGGGWLLGGASNAGGLWLGWIDRILAPGDPAAADARRVPVWVPHLRGERVPVHDPGLRAGLRGGDLTQGPAELRRAALEASAFSVRAILERAGSRPGRIVATGGGSASAAWLQALSDATGAAVDAVAVAEGAALGAAWLARVGAGMETGVGGAVRWARTAAHLEPRPAWRAGIDQRYSAFLAELAREERWR